MKLKYKRDLKNDPWTSYYDKLGEEVPRNDVERQVLNMLRQGGSTCGIGDCIAYMVQNGYMEEDFQDLYRRAGEWEAENMCVQKETLVDSEKTEGR